MYSLVKVANFVCQIRAPPLCDTLGLGVAFVGQGDDGQSKQERQRKSN